MKKNEEIADHLLRVAMDWQNGRGSWVDTGKKHWRYVSDNWPWVADAMDASADAHDDGASCALSEVAGMGFDIVGTRSVR